MQSGIIAHADRLLHLQSYANLNNPESVKAFIANKPCSSKYKARLCMSYNHYAKHYNISWKMPLYDINDDKMPKLPTEEQLTTLITGAGKILSLKLWLSKESGLRPIEVHDLTVRDIDAPHNAINPTTHKHGSPRVLGIPEKLTQALMNHATKYNLSPNDKLFRSNARKYGADYRSMRKNLARKLNRIDLLTVRLYDFRHWFATMRYMKYRDVPLTAEDMGHRDYNTTRKYLHLARILEMIKTDEWICKTASTIEESKALIENGYEYVTEQNELKLYRKRK